MKMKHWSGYGTVEAKKVAAGPDFLKVVVRGSHERGIERTDKIDVFNWLVKRFDRKRMDWMEIAHVDTDVHYEGSGLEVCTFNIQFRSLQ